MQTITLIRPDDWHLHLRDGAALRCVAPYSARRFARAVVMPNLKPPVTTVAAALAYRQRILAGVPDDLGFEPLMTLYLTESTTQEEIRRVAATPEVVALKLYPAGATTHSEAGVRQLERTWPVLAEMERCDVPLLIHGEVTDTDVDIFDREKVFIDRHLIGIIERFPRLRVVLEHVTTREGVQFVRSAGSQVAATITVHHLLFNRNMLLAGGIRPHYYCLPVLKREADRRALLAAAISGEKQFFLGTDSAPHPKHQKETDCGCAGCFTAPAALELYAMVFETAGALDRLEQFASVNGPAFYRMPVNAGTVTLERVGRIVPDALPCGDGQFIPLLAGEPIPWRIRSVTDEPR